jgi:hypothetical protein
MRLIVWEEQSMKIALYTFAAAALALMIVAPPAQACNGKGDCDRDDRPAHHVSGHASGAPAPIAGAGLPVLAIGYGVYWLIKRRRRVD